MNATTFRITAYALFYFSFQFIIIITLYLPSLPFPSLPLSCHLHLLQRLFSKRRQDEASLMNLSIVVPAQALLVLLAPRPHGLADIALGVLAADHEADLA